MKTFGIFLLLILMVFSVFAYKFRQKFNHDILIKQNNNLKQEKVVRSYVLSIIPLEVKSEILFNSVRKKFPTISEEDIFEIINGEKKEKEIEEEEIEEEEKEEIEKKLKETFSEVIDKIISNSKEM